MLTTDVSDYALKTLTEYFDKYCIAMYDRTYPLTDFDKQIQKIC